MWRFGFVKGFYLEKQCFIFSSPSVRRVRGQAMFRRMKLSPSVPYMLPGFIQSFSFSSSVRVISPEVCPVAEQSIQAKYVPSRGRAVSRGR